MSASKKSTATPSTPQAASKVARKTVASKPPAAKKVATKKVAVKQVVVKAPVAQAPEPVKVKPVKAASAAPLKATPAKPKLVRDSFTMPRSDFDLIDLLKERALGFKRATKKSELLRAGLHALNGLSDTQLKAALEALVPLKSGRPQKGSK